MQGKLSRTKIARYVVAQLATGHSDVLREVAAYLIESRRIKEADLVVRAILDQCEHDGVVLADVTSAYALDKAMADKIAQLTGAKKLVLREHVDPTVLGGLRVQTPSRMLDATIQKRIGRLRERKV